MGKSLVILPNQYTGQWFEDYLLIFLELSPDFFHILQLFFFHLRSQGADERTHRTILLLAKM